VNAATSARIQNNGQVAGKEGMAGQQAGVPRPMETPDMSIAVPRQNSSQNSATAAGGSKGPEANPLVNVSSSVGGTSAVQTAVPPINDGPIQPKKQKRLEKQSCFRCKQPGHLVDDCVVPGWIIVNLCNISLIVVLYYLHQSQQSLYTDMQGNS
jgi:hypothetical protein